MSRQVWFITGASSGLGKEIAVAAVEAGHKVSATSRNPDRLTSLKQDAAGRLISPTLDVTGPAQIKAAWQDTLQAFKRVDVVCLNAGFGMIGAIEEVPDAMVRSVYETNVFSVLELLRCALPQLRAQRSGHVILISSVVGLAANPGSGIYSSTKFALEAIGEALAAEMAPFGVKVTLVEPGGMRTGFAGPSLAFAPPSDAYAGTPASAWRLRMREQDGRKAGDPALAAAAVLDVAVMANPPLHLVLGEAALKRVRDKIRILTQELEQYEKVSASIDRPA